jgi:hypothetical protein
MVKDGSACYETSWGSSPFTFVYGIGIKCSYQSDGQPCDRCLGGVREPNEFRTCALAAAYAGAFGQKSIEKPEFSYSMAV